MFGPKLFLSCASMAKSLIKCFILIFVVVNYTSCVDSAGDDPSTTPTNNFIISIDETTLFGNASSIGGIVLNTEGIPDGSQVLLDIVSSGISGCLLDTNLIVMDKQAFASFIVDYVIGVGVQSSFRLLVIITTPTGQEIKQFDDVVVNGIGIIPPTPEGGTVFEIDIPDPPDSPDLLSLIFETVGIQSGVDVTFDLSNPALGALSSMATTVGSEGGFIVDYIPFSVAGTQVITATIELTTPASILALCPTISPGATIQATVIINQVGSNGATGLPNDNPFCSDGIDNDGDGLTDCEDTDAGDCNPPGGPTVPPCEDGTETTCNDALDNDGDGDADCLDNDCDGVSQCEFGTELTCNDGFDNDGDGDVDCDDTDCQEGGGGNGEDVCFENTCDDTDDNDGDGDADCLDEDCDGKDGEPGGGTDQCEFGTETSCSDGFDNDGDGDIDAADSDCP